MPKTIKSVQLTAQVASQARTQSLSAKQSTLLPLFHDIALAHSMGTVPQLHHTNNLVVKLRTPDFRMGPHKSASGAYFAKQQSGADSTKSSTKRSENISRLHNRISQLHLSRSISAHQVLDLVQLIVSSSIEATGRNASQVRGGLHVSLEHADMDDARDQTKQVHSMKGNSQDRIAIVESVSKFESLIRVCLLKGIGLSCDGLDKSECSVRLLAKGVSCDVAEETWFAVDCISEGGLYHQLKSMRYLQQMENGPPNQLLAGYTEAMPANT